MSHTTTVSVIAIVDMQDPVQGFVMNKQSPGARLSLGDKSVEHNFTKDKETHRFTVSADLSKGEHELRFEFASRHEGQGALEIKELYIQGAPIGLPIYEGTYHSWTNGRNFKGHLYMGWPGVWRYNLTVPMEQHNGDIGFE
jgi:hypothetical protein